jgi:hypothetical protein
MRSLLEYQAVRTQYRLDEGTDVAYDEKSSYVRYVHGTTFGRTWRTFIIGGTDMVSDWCTIPKRKLCRHMLERTRLTFSVCTPELERTIHTFSGNSLYHVEQGCASLM